MRLLKYSLILLSLNTFSFSGTDCFDSSFEVGVSHKSFPFGLLEKSLTVTKKGCELTFAHNQWKYLNKKWVVDICRDPIHIKAAEGSVDVFRKIASCNTVKNSFCKQYTKLKRVIEDDGLIFASGVKSEIESDHGKVYCSYVLIEEYLKKSVVFNKGQNYDHILKNNRNETASKDSGFSVDPTSGKANF